MTDNFALLKTYIENGLANSPLEENDSYFVVELIRRGKDNSGLPAANYHFKNYYIRKIEDLDKYESEIKQLCDMFKMRAYISVNFKSFKQGTLDTLAELARRVANGDYKKNYQVYESCSGKYTHNSNKRWIIDIDDNSIVNKVKEILNIIKPYETEKVILEVPTKNGTHLITRSFDLQEFYTLYGDKEIDIKKNHLTLLYENL